MLAGKSEDQETRALWVMLHMLIGAVIALLSCVFLLLLESLAISGGILQEGLMPELTVAACVAGSFIGGITAVIPHRSYGILLGVGVGVCHFLLLTTIGFLCFEGMSVERGGAILAGCLCGGALSGLLGGRKGKRRSKSKHKKGHPHGK